MKLNETETRRRGHRRRTGEWMKAGVVERGDGWATQSAFGLFFQESLRSLWSTASLFPSSRFLASALLKPVNFQKASILVELGSGTGAITGEILRRLPPYGRLYALELNRNFVEHLRARYPDPRLVPLHGSAEDLLALLSGHGIRSVHAVISSLGLTAMKPEQRTSIIRQAAACLGPGGVLTQYQYLLAVAGYVRFPDLRFHKFRERRFLNSFFREVDTEPVLLNLPPAVVFTCRK